jgi:hypothetical protein
MKQLFCNAGRAAFRIPAREIFAIGRIAVLPEDQTVERLAGGVVAVL